MAGNGKKVLLHACCGPCSIMCIQSLRDEGYDVTGYFANPNIHPVSEYFRRREAMEQVAEQMDLPMLWQDDVYDLPGWLKMVHDLGIADNQGYARCGYCYRIGGDEFVVLLPGCTKDAAAVRMEELRTALSREKETGSFSFGVAHVSEGVAENAEQLLRRADLAMYQDKAQRKR